MRNKVLMCKPNVQSVMPTGEIPMNECRRKINPLWLMYIACLWLTHTHAAPLHELKLPPEQVQEVVPRALVEPVRPQPGNEEQKKRNEAFIKNNEKIRELLKKLKNHKPNEG